MTISPRPNKIFTMSEAVRLSLSAMVCAEDPRTTFRTGSRGFEGAAGTGGAGAGVGVPGGTATGSGSARGGGASVAGTAFVLVFGLTLGVGASTTSLIFAAFTGFPPEALSRDTASSGTEDEAVLPSTPICSSAAISSLLVTPSSLASS